jgi:ABC-type cobalamin/Fe3+-siderophores transport system ATPase subunit
LRCPTASSCPAHKPCAGHPAWQAQYCVNRDGRLFTTHDSNHARRAASRAYLLRDGTRIAEGPVDSVLNRQWLEEHYRAPVEQLVDPENGEVAFLSG